MREKKKQSFVWEFDSPVEKVWPLLSDTQRINEASNFPKHDIEEILLSDGSMRFVATAKVGPFTIRWDDEPQNWVANKWLRHCRYFHNGPLKSLCAEFTIQPSGGGCRVEFTIDVEPRNLLGSLILATVFFRATEKTYARLVADIRAYSAGETEREFEMAPVELASGVLKKVSLLTEQIDGTDYGHGLATKLADYVTTRPEVDCATIRPLKLARLWEVPERLAIEACLQAAKLGLLGSRWDLLCPRCQVGKETVDNLAEMPTGSHCPSCNIDYERDFAKNLELAFYPSRAIRPINAGEYCLFGPMGTPHIQLQVTVEAGEQRSEVAALHHGVYRLRTLEAGDEAIVDWRGDGFPTVIADGAEIREGPPADEGKLTIINRTQRRLTFIVEEYTWRRDVLTAHKATTMQAFRQLFDEEVLRPGDSVEIDSVTIMFTDLKGSTAMYERLGDAAAYYLVRQFFAVLGGAIRNHNGSVVKTVGDSVNAVFSNPADGLACAIDIQRDVEAFNETSGKEPIVVTVGLHTGRCISVTLNDQLDYYGTAANKAARLEGQSLGGDIVLSEEFCAEPTVTEGLRDFELVAESALLKGFNEPVAFKRIPAEQLAERR